MIEAATIDGSGKLGHRSRFDATRGAIEAFVKTRLDGSEKVALEATTNTWAIVRVLQPLVAEVVVSNPMRTKAIAEAKIKTDKVDALVLAQLLRVDYLPRVWIPDSVTQARRHLTSRRASLVSDKTRLKNRLHAVLHQRMIASPVADLFSKAGRQWLAALELDGLGRQALDSDLPLHEALGQDAQVLDVALAKEPHA